ncbi:MFS transporter [Microlunatus sp. Gsoil 973]|uniref:MFS transporter n=1 Tax=Microlunatus sp. Gsoil 973 TaxID=2672569 RepID=UPI0021059FC7|nr:MFS transporter [Microlunatus sp. Gsoil 973]
MSALVEVIVPARMGRRFRWLLASSWTSNIGDGIAVAAGPLLVASQTDSAFLVALAALVQKLPWLAFGLWAGALADRLDRRKVVMVADTLRSLVIAALCVTIFTGRVNISLVLSAMLLYGVAEVFADTTTSTLLPMLVQKADLGTGNQRLQAGFLTCNQLLGPPVGAFPVRRRSGLAVRGPGGLRAARRAVGLQDRRFRRGDRTDDRGRRHRRANPCAPRHR